MLQKDAITAGYGVVTATLRKAASKLLGRKGVGPNAINALSVAAGLGLSKASNPHLNIIGGALRIAGLASVGNSLVERLTNKDKPEDS